jgi:hypothetical protein
MRVFLSAYGNFYLAIPINYISSIMLYSGNNDKKIEHNDEDHNTYISLPILFNYSSEIPRHGIILRNNENDKNNGIIENKTILLTTEIEHEINIQEERIYSMPKILDKIKISRVFSGILFEPDRQDKNMFLFLNPEVLVQNLQKELI